jgi:hypothetical protein
MAQGSPSIFDGSDEQLLDSAQTRDLFGGVSEQWIPRREKERQEEIARGGVPFPLPKIIGGRKYYQLGQLRAYRDSRPHVRVVHAPPPPRAPKGKRWRKGDKIAAASSTATSDS